MVWGTLSRDPAPCCASTTGAKMESLEMEVLGEGPPSQNVLQKGQAEPHGPGLGTSESSLNLRYRKNKPKHVALQGPAFSKRILLCWKSSNHQKDDVGIKSKVSGRTI